MGLEIVVGIVLLGLLFDYTNGFHDVANVVATSIGTRIVKPAIAILIATLFNFLGATQISGVAQTITTGLFDYKEISQAMVLSGLVGAVFWNFLTWYFGIPSSSSYALVGGLVGAAGAQGGLEMIAWKTVLLKVLFPMIVSPFVGLTIAFLGMRCVVFFKLKNLKMFRSLQLGSASLLALSHGLNDAQKSMAIITLGLVAAGKLPSPEIPLWVIALCAVMMALGTAFGGFRIIKTMAYEMTELKPAQGFVIEGSSMIIIFIASFLGMPLSSTHIITGSITGAGVAKGIKGVNWKTIQRLIWAWVLTIPGSASVSILFINIFF